MRCPRGLLSLLVALALAGCATGRNEDVQRATEGPTAVEIYAARFAGEYGREPTFEEMAAFRSDVESRVSAYLVRHPDLSTSPRAGQFTFHRRVAVGMTREEVALLAGRPLGVTAEVAEMAAASRQFWSAIEPRATRMETYPGGWSFYFDGDTLVDLTVVGKPPL